MQADLETIVFKFGRNRAICLRENAILGPAQKCPYHVTLKLGTSWMHADPETIVCKFGRNPVFACEKKRFS